MFCKGERRQIDLCNGARRGMEVAGEDYTSGDLRQGVHRAPSIESSPLLSLMC